MTRILITGSNSGFGKLAALSLARQGHDVIATMRTLAKGDDLRATAEAENLPIEIRRLDVSDPASVVDGIGDPSAIDVVVNNAGFEAWPVLWSWSSDELWTRQFDTNVIGPMRIARAVLPTWRSPGQWHDRQRVEHRRCRRRALRRRLLGVEACPRGSQRGTALRDVRHLRHPSSPGRTRTFDTGFHDNIVTVDGWEDSDYSTEPIGSVSQPGRVVGRRAHGPTRRTSPMRSCGHRSMLTPRSATSSATTPS